MVITRTHTRYESIKLLSAALFRFGASLIMDALNVYTF